MPGLTDAAIRAAKAPEEGKLVLADTEGLRLVITPSGSKLWQYRYRFAAKAKTLSIGPYPRVGLAAARDARDAARTVLDQGRDPALVKRLEKASNLAAAGITFEDIARTWYEHNRDRWRGKHVTDVIDSLEKHVFPSIGKLPIAEITPPVVLQVIRAIEQRGTIETAHRIYQRIGAVFQYGIAAQVCTTDPATMIKTLLKSKPRVVSQPAITDIKALRDMLRTVEALPAHPTTKLAVRFLALTFVRPDTLYSTPWSEIDAIDETGVWKIPEHRMKMGREFWIKLPTQAREIIEAVRPITGRSPFVFPNDRWHHKKMSNGAIAAILERAGYKGVHCGHGFRASFNTIMSEKYQGDATVDRLLDAMLAHAASKGPYNRAAQLDRRGQLLQEWADMVLDGFAPAATLTTGPRR